MGKLQFVIDLCFSVNSSPEVPFADADHGPPAPSSRRPEVRVYVRRPGERLGRRRQRPLGNFRGPSDEAEHIKTG